MLLVHLQVHLNDMSMPSMPLEMMAPDVPSGGESIQSRFKCCSDCSAEVPAIEIESIYS